MTQDLRGTMKKIFGQAKVYRRDKSMMYNIKDERGYVVEEPKKINEKWKINF